MSDETANQLTLFAEDSLARIYQLPKSARDFLESDQDFGLSSIEFLRSLGRDGLLSRTFPACYPVADVPLVRPLEELSESTHGCADARAVSNALSALPESECLNLIQAATLPSSFGGWKNSGMASRGGYLTLSSTEWHNAAAVCSLSEVLETDVPQKYYLSAKAAAGILRRAEKRGKELPGMLREALETVAQG